MNRLRVSLIGLGILAGLVLNTTLVPQIMTPRAPVFNGGDIAENWEWRSMAVHSHSWWLWERFPESTATHVGYVTPPGNPNALRVGMLLSQWMDEQGVLSTKIDASLPPLDISELGIRDDLYSHQKVYSRIHCRSGQEMEDRDTCYYFVSWSPELLGDTPPTFIGVLTNSAKDEEEMALVEENLLRDLSPVPLDELLSIDEIRGS